MDNLQAAVREWRTLDDKTLNVLFTGSEKNLADFALEVWPDVIDRRKKTVRARYWFKGDADPVLARLVEAAKKADVTLQLLCDHGKDEAAGEENIDLGGGASVTVGSRKETYPVVHLGAHGKKWGD